MASERTYYIALSSAPGVGNIKFKTLLKKFKTASAVWKAADNSLKDIFGAKTLESFNAYRLKVDPQTYVKSVENKEIAVITLLDKDYPARLSEIYDPPAVLYMKGQLKSEDNLAFAVVGTRKITSYGREVTSSLVAQLSRFGLSIVSGLARGVDALAHKVALENGARTIAVLGSGVDIIYPTENLNLSRQISKNGCLISEVPPGVGPTRGYFPARNRIISGLSIGVLITEAGEESGSLITANCALEQNREVFAVPGPIYSQLSKGPASLIKQGAKLVTGVDDIVEELNLEPKHIAKDSVEGKTSEEKKVMALLEGEIKHIDELLRETGFRADKLASLLLTMEIDGLVKNLGGGNYSSN